MLRRRCVAFDFMATGQVSPLPQGLETIVMETGLHFLLLLKKKTKNTSRYQKLIFLSAS